MEALRCNGVENPGIVTTFPTPLDSQALRYF